jgi:uncharacterized repeat protein (TIGR02543 family)
VKVGDYVRYEGNIYRVASVNLEATPPVCELEPTRLDERVPARTVVASSTFYTLISAEGNNLEGVEVENVDKLSIATAKAEAVAKGYVRVFFVGLGEVVAPPQDIKLGKKAETPTTPVVDHYTFDGWFYEDTFSTAVDFGNDTFTDDTVLYAKLDIDTYDITYDSKGGDAVASETVNYGEKFTKPTDPTKASHIFGGWYLDDNTFEEEYDFDEVAVDDVEVFAYWIEAKTVTFESNGGSAVDSILVPTGEAIEAPDEPTKDDYTFVGWFEDDGTFEIPYVFGEPVMDDITLYADWDEEN